MEDIKQENVYVEDAEAPSGSARRETPSIDARKERRLVLKQDLIIIPILWVMFFLAYLVSLSQNHLIQHASDRRSRIVERSAMPVSWASKRAWTCLIGSTCKD